VERQRDPDLGMELPANRPGWPAKPGRTAAISWQFDDDAAQHRNMRFLVLRAFGQRFTSRGNKVATMEL
jgi:hypothetical protein